MMRCGRQNHNQQNALVADKASINTHIILRLIDLAALERPRLERIAHRESLDLLSELLQELVVDLGVEEDLGSGPAYLSLVEATIPEI